MNYLGLEARIESKELIEELATEEEEIRRKRLRKLNDLRRHLDKSFY